MARRRTPSIQITDDNLVSSGLQLDRHTLKRLLWESASGVIFANGQVRRKKPTSLAFDIGNASPIRGLQQLYAEDGGRWLWAGAGGRISRWEFGAPEIIDPAFGTFTLDATATRQPTIYDFTPYGNWMIVNSGDPDDHAKIFKDPGYAAFAPGQAPDGVLQYLKTKSFVMALGYGQRGTTVGWSDANNIELWVPAADNSAGELAIDDFNTPIRAGSKLGADISVYSEDQLALVSFIGAPFYFGQRVAIDGIGAVGKAAVATDGKINVGVGRAGVWWTDGLTPRYIDEGWIANYLQDNVNWEQAGKIVAARNDYTGTFEFSFPMGASNVLNEGWAWDPLTGGWSPVPAFSFMDERRLFQYPIQGLQNGEVHLSDFENPLTQPRLSLVSKPLVMQTAESPHAVFRVDELDLLLHKANQIQFRIGSCDEPQGVYEYSKWAEAFPGARVEELDRVPEAPYWKLEFRSVPDRTDWDIDLQGFLMYGTETGSKMS